MITPKFFKDTCEHLFGAEQCTFEMYDFDQSDKDTLSKTLLFCRIKCIAFGRPVARLTLFTDYDSLLTVYPYNSEMPDKTTRFSFRVKRLLKWATHQELYKNKILDGLVKQFNNQFYRHSADLRYLIDKMTDDVFCVDIRNIAQMLNDKADMLQYGHTFRDGIPVTDPASAAAGSFTENEESRKKWEGEG